MTPTSPTKKKKCIPGAPEKELFSELGYFVHFFEPLKCTQKKCTRNTGKGALLSVFKRASQKSLSNSKEPLRFLFERLFREALFSIGLFWGDIGLF